MDVYLLNDNFEIVQIVDDFSSLIWRRKYHEIGGFELHCAHMLLADFVAAKYVYRSDRDEVGVIENYGLDAPLLPAFAKDAFWSVCLRIKSFIRRIHSAARHRNTLPEA